MRRMLQDLHRAQLWALITSTAFYQLSRRHSKVAISATFRCTENALDSVHVSALATAASGPCTCHPRDSGDWTQRKAATMHVPQCKHAKQLNCFVLRPAPCKRSSFFRIFCMSCIRRTTVWSVPAIETKNAWTWRACKQAGKTASKCATMRQA